MKKFIRVFAVILSLSFVGHDLHAYCPAFQSSVSHTAYGTNNGQIWLRKCGTGDFGDFHVYNSNGTEIATFNDVTECQWYTINNLPAGTYNVYYLQDFFWVKTCDEWRTIVVNAIYPCPVYYGLSVIQESSPGCNDGRIILNFDHLEYIGNLNSAYVYNYSNGQYYYGYMQSYTSYTFNNLPSGNYYFNFGGYPINNNNYCNQQGYVTVPGNPCQVTLSIDKADAIANCVNGSMVISTTDAGTYVYHVANLYDDASNLIRTKTFYSDKTDFDNVIPGNYTVEVRTYASYSSACYCSDTKPVTISSGGPLFYSPATTATDVGAHGCINGKVKVDFNNVNDAYYLNYWNIPYKARYTAYLYDANWNVVTSANNLYTGYEFTDLAPGNYNVLTVGTRYDAQGCNTPVWTNAIINQPSCITFDILSSTNTTTRCADDGTITASFTNWEGACDGYINLYKVAGTETLIDSWQIGDGALPITWSGLQSSLVFNGSYRVEAHAGDCTISQNVTVGVPSCNVVVSAVGSNTPGCTGNITGSINNACALKTIALFRGANPITTLTTTDNNYSFEGLPSGTYTVSVTASDNLSGCTATSTTKIRNANCPVPVNITATPTSVNKQILISWENYSCAMRYTLQYRIAGMTGWNSSHPTTNSKLLNNLFKNTVYEYRLKTECSTFYSSDYSPIQTFCLGTCAGRVVAAGNTDNKTELLIYPNPASDVVMIESGLSTEVIQAVNVFDQTGRMVSIDKTIEQGTVKINTTNFTDGIYFVQLMYPEGIRQGKFIIQK